MRTTIVILLLFTTTIATFTRQQPSQALQANKQVQYQIVGKYPRSNNQLFFTEGLSFLDRNTLMESTGIYGDSEIHFIQDFDQQDSQLNNRHQLDESYFGEGSDTIKTSQGIEHYMMTYKERKIFVFSSDLTTLKREYDMPKEILEGWGMTHYQSDDKTVLLVTDGSNQIFHVDPEDFTVKKTVKILDFQGDPLDQLNELEYFKEGTILANIWNTNKVARINIEDGKLVDMYSFQGIIDDLESESQFKDYADPFFGSVLNGIAYHEQSNRLIMGGKKWPYWYEVEFLDNP